MDWEAEHDGLVKGLHALSVLADHAPLDMRHFAQLNRVSLRRARQLMQTYENCGYAQRVSHRDLYVVTPLAVNMVGMRRPAGHIH